MIVFSETDFIIGIEKISSVNNIQKYESARGGLSNGHEIQDLMNES